MRGILGRDPGSSAGLPNSIKFPKYFLEIAEFISRRYFFAKKIVEIGVGLSPYVALHVSSKLPEAEIIVTDLDERVVKWLLDLGLKAFVDDVSRPRLKLYESADLIYSIRPPFELISKIIELSDLISSDILIAPLSEDAYLSELDQRLKRIRLKEVVVYLRERDTAP